MATIKVFSAEGVKELHCFDTLIDVPFMDLDPEEYDDEPIEQNPFA